jgi:hypothetical protein
MDDSNPRRISTPNPDPTVLTTASLLREITSLKELVFTRLDGMDRAVTLVPQETDKQISHLKELHDSRFTELQDRMQSIRTALETKIDDRSSSVQLQFRERDIRTDQTSRDNKVAVDAALQAAKELVGEQNRSSTLAISKSESSVAKQIEQIETLIKTGNKAVDDKFADAKDRITRLESIGTGRSTEHAALTNQFNWSVGIAVAILLSLAGFAFQIYSTVHRP